MNVLPDEVILIILSYLPHRDIVIVYNVCHRLREIASDGELWSNVYLSKDFTLCEYNKGFLVSLFEKIGQHIVKLSVDNESSLRILLGDVPCGQLTRLKELDISRCEVKPVDSYDPYHLIRLWFPNLESISRFVNIKHMDQFHGSFPCKKLRKMHLQFKKSSEDEDYQFHSYMSDIIKNHSNLEDISIHYSLMKDITVNIIFNSCKSLTSLSLQGCVSLDGSCFYDLPLFNSLTKLNLDKTNIKDEVIETLCNRCPALINLSILGCNCLTGNSIITITTYCKYLQHLACSRFKKTYNTKYSCDYKMIGNLTDLKSLTYLNCHVRVNDSIFNDICNCTNMTELELGQYILISNDSAAMIGQKLIKLKSLKVGYSSIQSAGVQKIISGCTQLKVLEIHSCRSLAGICFPEKKNGKHSHIQNLSLVKTSLRDEDLQNIANMCPDIHILNLSKSKGITDVSLEVVVKKCPFLTYLNISQTNWPSLQHHWNITDTTMTNISQYSLNLKYLNIRWNYKVTCDGLKKVLQSCRLLKRVNLTVDTEDKVGIKSEEFIKMRSEISKFRSGYKGFKWTLNSKGDAFIEFD